MALSNSSLQRLVKEAGEVVAQAKRQRRRPWCRCRRRKRRCLAPGTGTGQRGDGGLIGRRDDQYTRRGLERSQNGEHLGCDNEIDEETGEVAGAAVSSQLSGWAMGCQDLYQPSLGRGLSAGWKRPRRLSASAMVRHGFGPWSFSASAPALKYSTGGTPWSVSGHCRGNPRTGQCQTLGTFAKGWLIESRLRYLFRQARRLYPRDHPLPEPVRQAVGYLFRNRRRMDYARYRELGLPIGSGTVESACKTVVQAA